VTGAVTAAGITHTFGALPVLDDVALDAAAGECVAVVGPTGCGKSTLLRIFAGLVVPDAGVAQVDATSTIGTPGRCAYMPQGDTLLPWRRALDNAVLGARIAGRDLPATRDRAAALFARFGLAGFEDSWPHELSGGMRQRVALLRTVLVDQPVLLLDEPFGALDAITRGDLQGWLSELLRTERRTTLLVTHDVDEALRLADQVVVCSPRPARIIAHIRVPAAHPRSSLQVTDPDFAMLKRRIVVALTPPGE
jgi:ABC-type nitrate/sulfonate/bicarbonate transport system ATPase subunit